MTNKTTMEKYSVQDIIEAQSMLEPIQCVHCNHVGEVVYHQYMADGCCQICGKWQSEAE